MADSKTTALTAVTTFSGDELFYVVEDDDGTPVSRKVTVEDLAAGLFGFMGIASASTALTDTSPNSLSFVQWGTEEAVIAQADAPASAVVMVWLVGSLVPFTDATVGERGQARMEVSFNGGSSWTSVGVDPAPPLHAVSGSDIHHYFADTGRVTGTVTGDIQVRGMCCDVSDANSCRFTRGRINVLVHPQ